MRGLQLLILFFCTILHISSKACTIVAVSGNVTVDGRPLLLKNRDSSTWDITLRIGNGTNYTYLVQCAGTQGQALSGINNAGFSIVNSHSYNFPNTDGSWNAYIMQRSLEECATVAEFEGILNSLPKPMPVTANYGVMDAQGNVAIYEVNAYTFTKYDANNTACGYVVRTNHSLSVDTTGISLTHPTSIPRYQITNTFLQNAIAANGDISKEDVFGLTRCLLDRNGDDLLDYAPFDEDSYTPVFFKYYVPRRATTSAMIIQGVLPGEMPQLTTAWTMLGSPLSTVTIPFLITPSKTLPQKATRGVDGKAWLVNKGQQLKNSLFVNDTTINLAKLYNLSSTGIMQKIIAIEEEVLRLGNELVDDMRINGLSNNDVATYYAWVDYYLEEQYNLYFPNTTNAIMNIEDDASEGEIEYYDLLGRRVRNVPANAVLKRSGNKVIILN